MKYAFALAALVTSLAMPAYAAEPFPNRPMRLVVPFPAGGATDVVARMIAQKAGDQAGQPFIVDNRGGAAGNIGADNVAKSPGEATAFCRPSMRSHSARRSIGNYSSIQSKTSPRSHSSRLRR